MASIRELKKDIHFLTQELASESLFKILFHPEVSEDSANAIAMEGLSLRNELLARVNHSDGKGNAKLVKLYFGKVRKDLMDGFVGLFEKLSKLS